MNDFVRCRSRPNSPIVLKRKRAFCVNQEIITFLYRALPSTLTSARTLLGTDMSAVAALPVINLLFRAPLTGCNSGVPDADSEDRHQSSHRLSDDRLDTTEPEFWD